jgi:AraC family transcriptional regulator
MTPDIRILKAKKLVGRQLSMSYGNNRTFELWRSFMPERKNIKNTSGTDLYSVQVYNYSFDFRRFNPKKEFEKWATIEVNDFSDVPEGMRTLIIPEGLYAVFLHKGPASEGPKTFEYIFGTWLPASEYVIDNRPHFEILGDRYKNDDPSSEEEIWIPVRKK